MANSSPSLLVPVVVKLFELIKVEDFITNGSGLYFFSVHRFFCGGSKCNLFFKYSYSLK